jgi:hypothetical protein
VGNSRILACPDILRDCWLDELEYDAFLSLPGDSEQEKLRGIANWCLCYMVLIRRLFNRRLGEAPRRGWQLRLL